MPRLVLKGKQGLYSVSDTDNTETQIITPAGAVTADIQATAGSIGTAELANDAVDADKLASNAVVTASIVDDAVTSAKIDSNVIQTATVTLSATEIVGTDAGDIGHSAGAILVAAPGAGFALDFIDAVLIYDYDTAAYTGGGNDAVIRVGTVSASSAIAAADLLGASADKIVKVSSLSAGDYAVTENATINLAGTAYTQPGTAAGVLRVQVRYRVITTGL